MKTLRDWKREVVIVERQTIYWLNVVVLFIISPRPMSEKTLFQRIIDREVDADIVHEDEHCVAFRDIDPQAPTHILIVPRKPIPSLDDLKGEDADLVGHLFIVARDLAYEEGLRDGYRTVINCGDDGGQSVYHLHLHLLGGRRMQWPPG